jgi:hypothetical protein
MSVSSALASAVSHGLGVHRSRSEGRVSVLMIVDRRPDRLEFVRRTPFYFLTNHFRIQERILIFRRRSRGGVVHDGTGRIVQPRLVDDLAPNPVPVDP